MADEIKKTSPETPCAADEVGVSDVSVTEKTETTAVEKEVQPQVELDKETVPAEEAVAEDKRVTESDSFKESSSKVDDLIESEKKALGQFKHLIREALEKHEFTAPPSSPCPPKIAEEETKEEDREIPQPVPDEKREEVPKSEVKVEACEGPAEAPAKGDATEEKAEEKETPPSAANTQPHETAAVEKVEEKAEAVEKIKATIVHEVTTTAPATPPPSATAEVEKPQKADKEEDDTAPHPPEEISIWGVPLLADDRSDAILLKFLSARDFKVKEAFAMLKSVVSWRKEFKIDELLQEELPGGGLEKVVYIKGVDKLGHPVCYNEFAMFQDKEFYSNTFSDAEKRAKFLRWYIGFLEKNIRNLDFSPGGICTFVQVTDLKNSPGLLLFKKELRQATNQALQLLQDNYPEFVAKQVFVNVPWWYVAYNRMISPFLTRRTKSKFVFAGPTKTAETLFKYIAPEQVSVRYGGLCKEGEQEFTTSDSAFEDIIKPADRHTVELPATAGKGTLIWEVRVVGWDVSYGAEFVPSAEGRYTWVVQKKRRIGQSDEHVISCAFKIGEAGKVVLTFDNQSSKKKKLLYRFKIDPSE